jgi:hypothetical protein
MGLGERSVKWYNEDEICIISRILVMDATHSRHEMAENSQINYFKAHEYIYIYIYILHFLKVEAFNSNRVTDF